MCNDKKCQCSEDFKTVHCDTKGWENLDGMDIPSAAVTLTFVGNHLKFNTGIEKYFH